MSNFDNALAICSVLIVIILLPWLLFIFMPAFLLAPIGNSETLRLLDAQGYHWIVAVVTVIVVLISLAGAWLD